MANKNPTTKWSIDPRIPANVRNEMVAYAADPNSLTARNNAFQAFYKANPEAAGAALGQQSFQGYNGFTDTVNNAYGVPANAPKSQVNSPAYQQAQQEADNNARVQQARVNTQTIEPDNQMVRQMQEIREDERR